MTVLPAPAGVYKLASTCHAVHSKCGGQYASVWKDDRSISNAETVAYEGAKFVSVDYRVKEGLAFAASRNYIYSVADLNFGNATTNGRIF